MSSDNANVVVGVEQDIHALLREVFETIMLEHGLRVDSVEATWQRIDGDHNKVASLQITITSRHQ